MVARSKEVAPTGFYATCCHASSGISILEANAVNQTLLCRWAVSNVFYPPPAPIFMGRMWLANLLGLQGFIVPIVVVVLGFMYANHPWLMLLVVILTTLWAAPPHRGKGPMSHPGPR